MKTRNTKIDQYHLHKANPEKLQFEMYCLNEYRNRSADKAAVPHSHSYYQMIWFTKGGGTHSVDFRTYDVEENSVMFIAKDQVHCFDDNLEVEGKLIHFNESFFMHTDADLFLKYNVFRSGQNPYYTVDADHAATGMLYLDLIEKELKQRGHFGFEDVIRYLLKSLLINLERVHLSNDTTSLQFSSQYELQLCQFKDLLEDNFKTGWSVAEYAAALNVSTKTLTTITNTVAGKTPAQFISERVMLEAKRLLKFTSIQIGEVAFRLGFDDISYFVKYFKRYAGMTPSGFRSQ